MLDLKRSNLKPTELVPVGIKKVGVIDSIKDELRVEERSSYQLFSDENKRLYRQLKKQYKQFTEVSVELKTDLKKVNNKEA